MMKKRWLGVIALLALAAVGGAALLLHRERPAWSSDSPAAVAEYEACLDALRKFYTDDARRHCEKAVALDPSFTVAQLQLGLMLRRADPERAKKLLEAARHADLDSLKPRERFLVRYRLAQVDGHLDETTGILDRYLAESPDDPAALDARCLEAWAQQDFPAAEKCYRHLLEIDPNRVTAQNHLGYLAMAQGRFAEAEERFRTYRFVAPDQANPHDSLGELLTLVGRYNEATAEFEKALAVRPGFCASYPHLMSAYLLARDIPGARRAFERMRAVGSCGEESLKAAGCSLAIWPALIAHDWEAAWLAFTDGCADQPGEVTVLGHAAAAHTGRRAEALALEAKVDEMAGQSYSKRPEVVSPLLAIVHHMRGTRLLAVERDAAAAAAEFRQADEKLGYWTGDGLGIFKLVNRESLVRALRAAGRTAEADRVLAEIRAVNPAFAARIGREEPAS